MADIGGAAEVIGEVYTGDRENTLLARPPEIEIVRRAYELWEQSGKPEGRDQEFYLQALCELQKALDERGRAANTE